MKMLEHAPKEVVAFLEDVKRSDKAKKKIELKDIHFIADAIPYYALGEVDDPLSPTQQNYILDHLSARCTKCKLEIPSAAIIMIGGVQSTGDDSPLKEMSRVPQLEFLTPFLEQWVRGSCPGCSASTVEVQWKK